MSFNGDDHTRILSINDTHINVHNGAIIEYIAPFYKEHIDLPFIGMVLSDCSPNDTIIGIYIQPLYIYRKHKWYKISNYKVPIDNQYFKYPHLLMLPKYCMNYAQSLPINAVATIRSSDIGEIIADKTIRI